MTPMTECLWCKSPRIYRLPPLTLFISTPEPVETLITSLRLCPSCLDLLPGLRYVDPRLPAFALLSLALDLGHWTRPELRSMAEDGQRKLQAWATDPSRVSGDVFVDPDEASKLESFSDLLNNPDSGFKDRLVKALDQGKVKI